MATGASREMFEDVGPTAPSPLGRVSVPKLGLDGVSIDRLPVRALTRVPVPEGSKICRRCRRLKPAETAFEPMNRRRDGRHSWCRQCRRIAVVTYYEAMSPEDKERRLAKQRKCDRARYARDPAARMAAVVAWRETLVGKLCSQRACVKWRLRKAEESGADPARIEALRRRLEAHDAEIERAREGRVGA